MSDTKIQLRNSKNQEHINYLKRLYKQEKSIRSEIKNVKNMKKENYTFVSFGSFRDYDINWALKVLNDNLKIVYDKVDIERSQLVIC